MSYEYSRFDKETKSYINMAVDINSALMNRIVTVYDDHHKLVLTSNDKVILALFMAAFFFGGNLSRMLKKYNDIDGGQLLDFCGLNKICKLASDEEHREIYEKRFKYPIMRMICNDNKWICNSLTPESIFTYLVRKDQNSLRVINAFARTYLHLEFFKNHPCCKSIEDFAASKMNIHSMNNVKFNFESHSIKDSEEKKVMMQPLDIMDNSVFDFIDELVRKFPGQEAMAEDLFYNIINNQRYSLSGGERSLIFIDGPTGTGKTAIPKAITERLGLPIVSTSIINYSSTGYVGADITDVLYHLYEKANHNLALAERGIVILDEFDKLVSMGSESLAMKEAVQQQLLDFLGGGKYNIRSNSGFGMIPIGDTQIEFDTSKLTFICLGALTNLRAKKQANKTSIGFASESEIDQPTSYNIEPQDLVKIGLEKELVARFNVYLHTDDYSKDDLLVILRKSDISPMHSFEKWVNNAGKTLIVEDGVYEAIADAAYELHMGARSLQTIVNNIRTLYMKRVLNSRDVEIVLDVETVNQITGNMFKRKVK